MDATYSARWHAEARSAAAWAERERCFDVLDELLDEHRAPARPHQCPGQPPIRVPGVLTEVARRAHFASESVYRRWRIRASGPSGHRWAQDTRVKPTAAFIAEAKLAAFWPYRTGVLEVADSYDMTLPEVLMAYLRSLAAWAGDNLTLAACAPSGPPECVAEDMAVFAARRGPRTAGSADATRLTELSGTMVDLVLADPSLTPLGAFNAIREEIAELFAAPEPIAGRAISALTELSDRLMHDGGRGTLLGTGQARQMLTTLSELSSLLADATASDQPDGRSG